MTGIFISYSHRDQPFARQLDDALAQCGYTTWLDKKDVFPAGEFWEDIEAGIQESGAFIFIMSPDSLDSKDCIRELDYAQAYGKKLIPVLYRGIDPSRTPQPLKDLDWIDGDPFDQMLEKLLNALLIDKKDWDQAGQLLKRANEWNKHQQNAGTPFHLRHNNRQREGDEVKLDQVSRLFRYLPFHKIWYGVNSGILLYGDELKRAEHLLKKTEHWGLNGHDRRPQLHPLASQFIRESRRAANRLFLRRMIVLFLCVSLAAGGALGGAFAFLYHDPTRVSTLQDNNSPGSLRYAVNQSPAKSTITFDTSLRGTILLTNGDLDIAKDLTIRGPGAGLLSISSGKSGSVVRVAHGVTVTISGLTFKNSNTSTGFVDNEGTLRLTNSIISGNTSTNKTSAQFTGGGISNHGTLTLSNSIISGNMSTYSVGGIFNEGTLTLSNSIISGNTAGAVSGGMLNTGTLTLSNSIVSGNMSYGAGGGIYNYGTLTLSNSTVSGNKTSAGATGGGIYNIGALRLNNSTVSGNMSGVGGGITNQGALTLINSTVTGNSAREGGGILIQGYTVAGNQSGIAPTDLTFSTVYGNIASTGGSIAIADYDFNNNKPIKQISVVQIIASIVASDPAHPGPDIVGMLKTYGYNLFQENSGATFDPTTSMQHGTDRTLSANDLTRLFGDPVGLQNNGGPTRTYALGPGSPAIDVVPYDFCWLTDQRGVKRPDGNEHTCDIGAYEYQD